MIWLLHGGRRSTTLPHFGEKTSPRDFGKRPPYFMEEEEEEEEEDEEDEEEEEEGEEEDGVVEAVRCPAMPLGIPEVPLGSLGCPRASP